jgi:hypothetical protein
MRLTDRLEPIMWRRRDALLVQLIVPTDDYRAVSTLAARLLGCRPKDLLVEYGPRRADACAAVGVSDPSTTLLYICKSNKEQ